ncbi:hypothetical protein FOZ63_033658 [Perkinsus olseni]|uniref:Uncharacterized protein n=1 Tax=Perkinsus olseni TaxID=32597 RepID=A0A7J6THK7_PEROL|nr:hypothetical protein FOZ63_033658 [Perkinsus olseni]
MPSSSVESELKANMVENPCLQSLCKHLDLDQPQLLVYLKQEEFDVIIQKAITDKKVSLAEVLGWREAYEKLLATKSSQRTARVTSESSTISSKLSHNGSTVSTVPTELPLAYKFMSDMSSEEVISTSDMVELISEIPLPGKKCFEGHQDGRSISWYLERLADEAKMFELQPKGCWLYLLQGCSSTVRAAVTKATQQRCGTKVWMTDYRVMLQYGLEFLKNTYNKSDEPAHHEVKL